MEQMGEFRDRRAGLVAFGIVQIAVGLACIGLVLLVAAGQELAARAGMGNSGTVLASALVVYGLAAVYFVSVGVGSIRARRWACALSTVVSAVWLAAGIVAALMLVVIMARLHTLRTGGCAWLGMVIGGIAIPAMLFAFYRNPHVRATCRAYDPKPRWTDRTPLPVLAVSIVLAFTAVALLANLASPNIAIPGRVVSGAPASIALFAFAVLCAVLAVQLYRLKEMAWWSVMLLQIAGMGYAIVTYLSGGFDQARQAGEPDLSAIYRDPLFIGVLAAAWIAYFAYILYLRRYFALPLRPRTRREDQSTFSA